MSTMIITAGHTGLGLEAAKRLAANKSDLILAGRDLKRVEAAARDLRQQYGVEVDAVPLDLGSLASVRAAADACRVLLASRPACSLRGLLCNAGSQFQGPIS